MAENSNSVQNNTCHSNHSFEWASKVRATSITCKKLGTVKNSLRRSPQFQQLETKNKLKELVILKHGRPIASHAPCTILQPGERLMVKYVKPASSYRQPLAEIQTHTKSSQQLVVFNVVTKGGKNISKIIRNPSLRSYAEFTVYAFKEEKVKHALKRDGRFVKAVFDKTCALSDINTNVTTEMSNLVNDLNGKTFQIILIDRCNPPDSQPSSLEDLYITNESHSYDLDENRNALELQGNLDVNKLMMNEIPGSRQLCSHLQALMSEFFKNMLKDKDKSVVLPYNLLRVEYGRSQDSFEVIAMKKLMDLSGSVCQVRINGCPAGTGFLLFDNFVLTAGHVIKQVFIENTWHLSETVTVHFSFESLEQTDSGWQVQEVVAFEDGTDVSGHIRDWTLLSLGSDQDLPSGLLTHCGFLPQSGSICLIGHPHGGVKKIESSLIIPANSRSQVVETHYNQNVQHSVSSPDIHFLTQAFFQGVAKTVCNSKDLHYETCFYFGSSGSPVFDNRCNLLAMHAGGYVYTSASGQTQSVIEYGHSISVILENLIVQLVRKGRLDVLKKYIQCPNKLHEVTKNNVKKLVKSRNYAEFKHAANNKNIINDDVLKMFFEFICGSEPLEPMDILWS